MGVAWSWAEVHVVLGHCVLQLGPHIFPLERQLLWQGRIESLLLGRNTARFLGTLHSFGSIARAIAIRP